MSSLMSITAGGGAKEDDSLGAPTPAPAPVPAKLPCAAPLPLSKHPGTCSFLCLGGKDAGSPAPTLPPLPRPFHMPSPVSTRSKTCPGLWDHHLNTGPTDPFLEGFPVTSLGLGLVTYQPHPKVPRRWSLPAGHGAHLTKYRATQALPRWAQQP